MAKVALRSVVGLDLPVPDSLNAIITGVGEAAIDHAFDDETLAKVVSGDEVASKDMQGVSKASYEAVKMFITTQEERKEELVRRGNGYVDFRDEMTLVPDGKGGRVWVSNRNVQRWLDSR